MLLFAYLSNLGMGGSGVVPPLPPLPELGGAKARRKIRGPYSDPRIYEAYIARCIAERERPRVNVQAAIIKEALVAEVEERRETEYAEIDALLRENQLLERLLALEATKRDAQAIAARQRQIALQIDEIEEEETLTVLRLLDDL